MATITNQAALSYNGVTTLSNIAVGELVEVLTATKDRRRHHLHRRRRQDLRHLAGELQRGGADGSDRYRHAGQLYVQRQHPVPPDLCDRLAAVLRERCIAGHPHRHGHRAADRHRRHRSGRRQRHADLHRQSQRIRSAGGGGQHHQHRHHHRRRADLVRYRHGDHQRLPRAPSWPSARASAPPWWRRTVR